MRVRGAREGEEQREMERHEDEAEEKGTQKEEACEIGY